MSNVPKRHLSEAPEYEFETGTALKIANEPDPEDYYLIQERVWNYDTEIGDYGPIGWYQKQYVVGSVLALGGDTRLVKEKDLLEHYEVVDKETAQSVLDLATNQSEQVYQEESNQ